MAKVKVKIPQLGLTIEEAALTDWFKAEGDTVAAGDVIASIEADKASYDIEAPAPGKLVQLLVDADDSEMLPIGTAIAVIEI